MKRFHIGTDIVNIQRIQSSYNRYGERFLHKFLTLKEIEEFHSHGKTSYLASRWAAKEALYKALSHQSHWKDIRQISIVNNTQGAPVIEESSSFEHWDFDISLSHEKDYCVAFVLATKNPV